MPNTRTEGREEEQFSTLKPDQPGRGLIFGLAAFFAALITGRGQGLGQDRASFRAAFSSSLMPGWVKTILTRPHRCLAVALVLLLALRAQAGGQDGNLEKVTLRVGFTKSSFTGVSRNDAEAAFKAFTESVGSKRGYLIRTETEVFDSVLDIEAAIKKGAVVLFILTTWDYLSLRNPELIEPQFVIMKELNPQVGNMLQAIAASEPYVDSMIAFGRSGWESKKQREDMYRGLEELHLEPAGQQILTLFNVNQVFPFKESYLDTAKELHATYVRLREERR